ncbi:MAG: MFS transporter, partial [Spirochaetales bacterium]
MKFSAYGFLKNLRFFDPFLVLFFLEKGISYLEIGGLYAIREIAVNFLEIPTGAVADALGRRRTMIASFVSYLISFGIFWAGGTVPAFVLAMLLFSFGEAFRTGTHKAMIFTHLRLTGNERFKADYYGHTRGWSQIGSAVSAAIAAAIVFTSGNYKSVFLFSTIPYVADLALMLTYPRELDGVRKDLKWSAIGSTFRELFASLIDTFRRPNAIKVVASASYYSGFYKGTKDFLQPLVAALALSLPWAMGLVPEKREALLIGAVYTILYALTAVASRSAGT